MNMTLETAYRRRQLHERNRRVYFQTQDGRAALRDSLEACGIFRGQEEWAEMMERPEASLRMLIEGLLLLRDCGVLIPENFDNLIVKMGQLPLPDLENEDHGKTERPD
jgi:hypothetical protein